MKLLIVDDIATNRKLLRVTLEAEGHTTVEATDGIDALRVLARETVDAVISDVLMPNMDGFRLCHEIRRSERLHALPFIICTSTYTSPGDMKLGQSLGADRYLTKPTPIQAVIRALFEVVDKNAERPLSSPMTEESSTLKQYSETLVNRLHQQNTELHAALGELHSAHASIWELNSGLEYRVKERTSELETANLELTTALAEVKRLNGLLCQFIAKT